MIKKISKAVVAIILSLLILFWIAVAGLNLGKFAIYSDYYKRETELCTNPGLNDGFVCQGIAADEASGKFLVSGYMNNKNNSRIYVTDKDNKSYYVSLTREGKKYTGHAGGIAIHQDTVYIANGSKLYLLSLSDVLSAKNADTLDIGAGVKVNNAASFVYCDDNAVYVGEYNAKSYEKNHIYNTPEGKNSAIVTKYSHSDLTTPEKIYSIRDYAQGICFTPDGEVVLSTSHGLTSTIYYIYDESAAKPSGELLDGAPVYFFEKPIKQISGPAMGEDLDWYDGGIISLTESASNKYLFGKLFFATNIFHLDI